MSIQPPKIDERTFEDIVKQTISLAECDFIDLEEYQEKKQEILNKLIGRNLAETIWTFKSFKKITIGEEGDEINQEIANKILKCKHTEKWPFAVEIQTSTKPKKVRFKEFNKEKKDREYQLIDRTLAEDIHDEANNIIANNGDVINETIAKNILHSTSLTKVKVKQLGYYEIKIPLKDKEGNKISDKALIGQTLAEDIKDDKDNILYEQGKDISDESAKYILNKSDKTELKIKTRWQPSDKPDAGMALIRIFARMATSITDRLNKVPEKNFLAFLNLIGAQRHPPQPARVPITFNLAAGSTSNAVVPARTQVSAPPDEGSDEEVIFETEQELIVSAAQLQAVFVRGSKKQVEYYSDRTAEATGKNDDAFKAFVGDKPIEHYLYLACEEVFSLPQLDTVTLTFETGSETDAKNLKKLLGDWCYWDGKTWQTRDGVTPTKEGKVVKVKFGDLSTFKSCRINGQEEKWLRIGLKSVKSDIPEITNITANTTIRGNILPQSCLFNDTPLDLSKDFYPFGEEPRRNDTFYIALDDELIKPEVKVTLKFNISKAATKTEHFNISWEFGDGKEWTQIPEHKKVKQAEGTTPPDYKVKWEEGSSEPNFAQPETKEQNATLEFSQKLPQRSTVNEETHYWIRAVIKKGHFGTSENKRELIYFEDCTFLSSDVSAGAEVIKVDSLDGLEVDNLIRFQPNNKPPQEKRKIKPKKNENGTITLTLDRAIKKDYPNGTRIQKKYVVTETIPETFDPPIVESLKLSYNLTINKKVDYCAFNDFRFFKGESWSTNIAKDAKKGDTIIKMENVDYLAVGEFLVFDEIKYKIVEIGDKKKVKLKPVETLDNNDQDDDIIDGRQYEIKSVESESDTVTLTLDQVDNLATNKVVTIGIDQKQIVLVNRSTKQVTLKSGLLNDLPKDTPVFRPFYPVTPLVETNPTLYFGFQQEDSQPPFGKNNTTLYLDVQPPLPTEVEPTKSSEQEKHLRIIWEYSSPNGWKELGVKDETEAFSRRGLIQFLGPGDFSQRQEFGKQLYWLRARRSSGSFKFGVEPRLKRVLTNTVWATQTESMVEEILGSSTDEPKQQFQVRQPPVLFEQRLEVEEGSSLLPQDIEAIEEKLGKDGIKQILDEDGQVEAVWVTWKQVEDFYTSNASDRHYTLDRLSGWIQFGDGKAGKIPPRGRNNLRITYQTGGGTTGNQKARTITQLKTTIPYVDGIINLEDAQGGAAEEDLHGVKQRVPKKLRHRGRAVTLQDFEDLAYAASTEVARVKVIAPTDVEKWNPVDDHNWLDDKSSAIEGADKNQKEVTSDRKQPEPGKISVIIVPKSSDRIPTPSIELINRVENYLRERCLPTVALAVSGPKWQEITVETKIVPTSLEGAAELRTEVQNRLSRFLHPLTGGKTGDGWSFGRKPHESDLYALLQSISGVYFVKVLKVNTLNIVIDDFTLIYSGENKVNLEI